MNEVTLKWLRSLNHERIELDIFAAELRGEPAVGSTNGHGFAVVARRLLEEPAEEDKPAHDAELAALKPFKAAPPLIGSAMAAEAKPVDLAAVKAWASAMPHDATDCTDCYGTGFVVVEDVGPVFDSDGNGPLDGPLYEHCSLCDHGYHRPGVIAAQPMNRVLLRRYLGPLDGAAQIAVVQKGQLAFIGDGWLVVVMGLRDGMDEGCPVFGADAEHPAVVALHEARELLRECLGQWQPAALQERIGAHLFPRAALPKETK